MALKIRCLYDQFLVTLVSKIISRKLITFSNTQDKHNKIRMQLKIASHSVTRTCTILKQEILAH